MAKKLTKKLKLVIPAGKATPGQPLGPTLGQAGVNIGGFIKEFNDKTASMVGEVCTVELSVYEDRSFSILLKTAPASSMILKAIGQEKGSGKNKVSKAGTLTKAQVKEIAEKKLPDLNATDINAAMRIIEGQARSMGVEVK